MADFELSSAFVDSIVRGLRRTEHFDALMAGLSPEARTLVNESWSVPWQPGRAYVELGAAASLALGEEAFEALSYASVKERFGPIVLPMLKRALTNAEGSPAAILAKLDDLVKVAMRGLVLHWKATDEHGGWLRVTYPYAVGAHLGASWRGVLRFVFEVSRPGTVADLQQAPDGTTFHFRLTW